MVAHIDSTLALPPQVEETQIRTQVALDRALTIERLSSIDEQRFSAVFIGLVDLQHRLRKAANLCCDLDLPAINDVLAGLQDRAWRGAALLDAMSALYGVDITRPDALDEAAACSRHLVALERTSADLFT